MPTSEQVEALIKDSSLAETRISQGCCPWCGIQRRGIDFCQECKGPWTITIAIQRFSKDGEDIRQCPLCGVVVMPMLSATVIGRRGSCCTSCEYFWTIGETIDVLTRRFPFLARDDSGQNRSFSFLGRIRKRLKL